MARAKTTAGLVLAMALAACGSVSTSPSTEKSVAEAALPERGARLMPAPDCGALNVEDTPSAEVICQLQTAGGILRFAITPPEKPNAATTVKGNLIGPADGIVQTIEVGQWGRFFPPALADIDGNGAQDLVITTDVGNVNATQSVWLFNPNTARFVEAGEIVQSGNSLTSDGLVAVVARVNAASYATTFFSVIDFKLVELATATVTLNAGGKVESCSVERAPANTEAIAALKLTPAQADAKFCGYARAQVAR